MNSDSNQIQALQRELAYYKKQVDLLSGKTISNQYAFAQLSNVCKKYINGFQIIADIQRSFSFYTRKEVLYEQFIERIFSQMFLDKVMLLETTTDKKQLRPFLHKGFNEDERLRLNDTRLSMPDIFQVEKKSFLVNSEIIPSEFEQLVQAAFSVPYFILIPLVKNQQVWGALFVGMMHEFKPMSYVPLSISNIDMFESLAGMISAMTQQLEQLETIERERNRIARDMHDDIGSELSKISITCEHLKNRFPANADVIKDISIIKDSAGSIVSNIGNIIWALNPVNNTMDSLLGYLREYIFDYLEMHRLAAIFSFPETSGRQVIPHETRTHIFMVVKEALHNVVKHANASAVTVRIVLSSNTLTCSVTDNGAGMAEEKNNSFGNGLRNMRERITESGGSLSIGPGSTGGTTVELEVPF